MSFDWHELWARPSALSNCLLPASWLYRAAVAMRPVSSGSRVEGLKVISVGNLVAGGAGKTPLVLFLAERALAAGHTVAVLSRGYGRRSKRPVHWHNEALPSVDEAGDEPRLIARRLPMVHLFIDSNRVAAANAARRAGCDVAILDDGFQHRALFRDVNILIDAGLGNRRLLPAGPLREPLAAARFADVIWSRVSAPSFDFDTPRLHAVHELNEVLMPDGTMRPASVLNAKRVVALSAIARPFQFEQSLKALGAVLTASQRYKDHHRFTRAEMVKAVALARATDAQLVTTEKDRERLPDELDAWFPRVTVRLVSPSHDADVQRYLGF